MTDECLRNVRVRAARFSTLSAPFTVFAYMYARRFQVHEAARAPDIRKKTSAWASCEVEAVKVSGNEVQLSINTSQTGASLQR